MEKTEWMRVDERQEESAEDGEEMDSDEERGMGVEG